MTPCPYTKETSTIDNIYIYIYIYTVKMERKIGKERGDESKPGHCIAA